MNVELLKAAKDRVSKLTAAIRAIHGVGYNRASISVTVYHHAEIDQGITQNIIREAKPYHVIFVKEDPPAAQK